MAPGEFMAQVRAVMRLRHLSYRTEQSYGKYTLNVTNIPDAVDYETPVVSPDNAASADGPSTVADEPPGIGV
jgi:hypothetical protein